MFFTCLIYYTHTIRMKRITWLTILIVSISTLNTMAVSPEITKEVATRFARFWQYIPQEKIYLHTDKPYYSAGEDIWFKAYLINASTHQPTTKSQLIYVELTDQKAKLIKRIKIRKDSLGFSGKFNLPPTTAIGFYSIRAYTNWMRNNDPDFFFHKGIMVGNGIHPSLKKNPIVAAAEVDSIDIQFLPEAGVLLDNQLQTIAFKAIGKDGLSRDIYGSIFNQNNEELLEFKSLHKGMGRFVLRTNPGESYYAVVNFGKQSIKKVLPVSSAQGISLTINNSRGKIMYQLLNQTQIPGDSLYLMAHSRGVVYFTLPLVESLGVVSESLLPAGIISFSIINRQGKIFCERLSFIRNSDKQPQVQIITQKTPISSRANAEIQFNILQQGKPWAGKLSASITDFKYVQPDTSGINIRNYFLLSSDLKGYIENPEDYFKDDSPLTREKTEILMLTQGWKRFNTSDLLTAKYPINNHFLEGGQSVSGSVYNILNKPVANSEIIAFVGYKNQIRLAVSDSLGRFVVDGIQFPDSTGISIKAKSKSKILDVGIIADKETFPDFNPFFPSKIANETEVPDNYTQLVREKFIYEGGVMNVLLDEFNVEAKSKKKNSDTYYYSGASDYSISGEKMDDYLGLDIMSIIGMLPGVQVNGDQISVRNAGSNPLFVVNGVETDRLEDVQYLNTSDIDEIALFKGVSTAIFGSRGGNGVITISLKKGAMYNKETPSSLTTVQPLGFQKPESFYTPKYDVDSVRNQSRPDLRSTISWQPYLQTDESGNVSMNFFTADRNNDYWIELEGISNDGSVCRYNGLLKRR